MFLIESKIFLCFTYSNDLLLLSFLFGSPFSFPDRMLDPGIPRFDFILLVLFPLVRNILLNRRVLRRIQRHDLMQCRDLSSLVDFVPFIRPPLDVFFDEAVDLVGHFCGGSHEARLLICQAVCALTFGFGNFRLWSLLGDSGLCSLMME